MKKKSLVFLFLMSICLILSGCKKKDDNKDSYYGLKEVAPYLYEISYKDYPFDKNSETVTNVEDVGCSSVKNGNFYGRNFDFIFNDVPEFVIKVEKKKGRHASLGVTMLSTIHEGNDLEKTYKDKLILLPNFMLDGINDQGVIASINVVPKADTLPITGTNPGKEDLNSGFIVRYVLDNADSAEDAIKLLSERNIYGDVGEHYNLHVMIADKNKTYIVEFIDNKMVTEEKLGNEQIMTNFYTNLDELTENSAGVERYKILQENYDEGSSFDGMWNLLKRVKYSQAYLFNQEEMWYSEFLPQSVIKKGKTAIDKYMPLVDESKKGYWVARTYDERTPANTNYWLTTHNSTYDISKKKLRITIQEDYTKYYEYTL